jgi:hypothetical protein
MNVITMTTTTTKQTAAAAYDERFQEAQDLLKRIANQLVDHKAEQAQSPRDWGHPGSLAHVNDQLAYVLASLGDRSAVDAKGLEY